MKHRNNKVYEALITMKQKSSIFHSYISLIIEIEENLQNLTERKNFFPQNNNKTCDESHPHTEAH